MMMKCAYPGCSTRRLHHESPHQQRPHQLVEVPDGYQGTAYCSIECLSYNNATYSEKDLEDQDGKRGKGL